MRRATFALDVHLPPPFCLNGFATRARTLLRNFISPETPRRQSLREAPKTDAYPRTIYVACDMSGVGGQLLTLYSHHLEAGLLPLYCFMCTKGSVQHILKGKITKLLTEIKSTEVAKRCDALNHSFSSRCGWRPWLAITTNLYCFLSPVLIFFLSLHVCCLN